jgi:hypothetical protein
MSPCFLFIEGKLDARRSPIAAGADAKDGCYGIAYWGSRKVFL